MHFFPLHAPTTDSPAARTASRADSRAGFTFVELLVVLAVLGLLAMLILPAAARTQNDNRAFQCLNNNRQLNRAWRMWSDDNEDRLLAATAVSGDPSVVAWVTGVLDYSPANPSNWDFGVDIMKSPLWLYCRTNLSIWKCPSDQSKVIINGEAKPRVRSFAMNTYFGNLDSFAPAYRSFKKFSEISAPSPHGFLCFSTCAKTPSTLEISPRT